jgi:arginyl-tRNA synthetase
VDIGFPLLPGVGKLSGTSILGADSQNEKLFRVQLSNTVANTIKNAFSVLGIDVPNRM